MGKAAKQNQKRIQRNLSQLKSECQWFSQIPYEKQLLYQQRIDQLAFLYSVRWDSIEIAYNPQNKDVQIFPPLPESEQMKLIEQGWKLGSLDLLKWEPGNLHHKALQMMTTAEREAKLDQILSTTQALAFKVQHPDLTVMMINSDETGIMID